MSEDYLDDLGSIDLIGEDIICKIKGKGNLRYKIEAYRLFIIDGRFASDCLLIGIDQENNEDIELEFTDKVIIISEDILTEN